MFQYSYIASYNGQQKYGLEPIYFVIALHPVSKIKGETYNYHLMHALMCQHNFKMYYNDKLIIQVIHKKY